MTSINVSSVFVGDLRSCVILTQGGDDGREDQDGEEDQKLEGRVGSHLEWVELSKHAEAGRELGNESWKVQRESCIDKKKKFSMDESEREE